MYRTLERLAEALASALALGAGLILLALIGLTCLSILGRALLPLDIGLGPVRGIFDLTEMGMAIAIFAFLPWAQLREAHARVDLFASTMPDRLNRAFDLLFNMTMAAVALVGSWRLYLGMQDKLSFGETTVIAQIPLWQGYAASLVGASSFAFVSLFCVLRSGRRLAGLEQGEKTHVAH